MQDELMARRLELEAERQRFLTAANQQLAAYTGAIGEIRRLLGLPPEGPQPEGNNAPELSRVDHPGEPAVPVAGMPHSGNGKLQRQRRDS